MNADEFFARLRRPTARPLVPVEPPPAAGPASLDVFEAELGQTRGQLSRVSEAGLGAELCRIAETEKTRTFVTWRTPAVERFSVAAPLERMGLTRIVPPEPPADARLAIEAADLGIVDSELAVVENGSAVLWTGAGRPRLVACLPRVLIVLLHDLQLLASLEELAAVIAARPPPATFVLVNGPSCTADVKSEDLRPIEGMHGPHRVHVVVIGS